MLKINSNSIQTKINIVLILLTTTILILFGAYDYFATRNKLTVRLNSISNLVANRLPQSMVVALWEVSKEMGIANVQSELAEKRIYAITVRMVDEEKPFVAMKRDDSTWEAIEFNGDLEGSYITRSADVVRKEEKLGTVEVFLTKKYMDEELRSTLLNLIIKIFILDMILVLGMSLVIRNILAQPLSQIIKRVSDIAEGQGNLTMRIDFNSKDEVGTLAGLFNTFIGNLQRMIQEVSKNSETLSESSIGLSSLSNTMFNSADQMSARAGIVTKAIEETDANMGSLAAAMEEASINIGVVAASAEEMSATINEVAQNSEKASIITGEAVTQVTNASARVDELGNAAQEIGKVTETITDISEQTNLLALNATIEAARAGEAGKGFAVVANEIKELAKQTAFATGEIKAQIEGVQESTSYTVTEIGQILNVINEINEIVSTIATAVEEQSVTTKEIANNVAQASQGIQEVNENVAQSNAVSKNIAKEITDVNQATGEISNSSSEVNLSAKNISNLAGKLREMVERFKV